MIAHLRTLAGKVSWQLNSIHRRVLRSKWHSLHPAERNYILTTDSKLSSKISFKCDHIAVLLGVEVSANQNGEL